MYICIYTSLYISVYIYIYIYIHMHVDLTNAACRCRRASPCSTKAGMTSELIGILTMIIIIRIIIIISQ